MSAQSRACRCKIQFEGERAHAVEEAIIITKREMLEERKRIMEATAMATMAIR